LGKTGGKEMSDVQKALEAAQVAEDNVYFNCVCDECTGCPEKTRAAILAFLRAMPTYRECNNMQFTWEPSDIVAAIEREAP
jgi:urate oxidase